MSLLDKTIRAVFTDLDDTLTERGVLKPETYQALCALHDAGYWLVVVSGRPAGSADCLMRLWPIDAMIFENGAGLVRRREGRLETIALASPSPPELLQNLFAEVKREIPEAKLASDQRFRRFDFAIDYAEEPPFLEASRVARALEILRKHPGILAQASSVHINYWFGTHTKVTACEHLLQLEGEERGISQLDVVYFGDAPNDEPLFSFFENTVGVANIRPFLPQMKKHPRLITQKPHGAGFCEIVNGLLAKA